MPSAVETGAAGDILRRPQSQFTHMLIAAVPGPQATAARREQPRRREERRAAVRLLPAFQSA